MTLQLRLLTSSDVFAELAVIKHNAFRGDKLFGSMYPLEDDQMIEWYTEGEMQDAKNTNLSRVVVVDTETESIIAYAHWHSPRGTATVGTTDLKAPPAALQPPAGFNAPLRTEFRSCLGELRNRHWQPETQFALTTLATHPKHQGRGCARMLLRWGIEKANRANASIYLDSSPSATGLYSSMGWLELEKVVIPLDKDRDSQPYVITAMIRNPTTL
ncbi:hypothetical protein CEP53_002467 [Fusarium sp. AF-6]|nr:hypothetical protein CEP53_002467 [Fusarium sp. AF-6]